MAIPSSYTFFADGTVNAFTWTVSQNGAVVNSASVTITLFQGRDRINPDIIPGTPVPNFTDVNVEFSSDNKDYEALILFAAPAGGDYIIVVDVLDSNDVPLGHWERPAVVSVSGA